MRYAKDTLEVIVRNSNNYSDACRKLGLRPFYGNRRTLKKYIDFFEINTNHFNNRGCGSNKNKIDLKDILVENSTYTYTTTLKNRLYKEGLKEKTCELCGQGEEWNGNHMSLILDHINGFPNDNRIDNLRIVCPNCNATLDTHCGKNIKRKYISEKNNIIYIPKNKNEITREIHKKYKLEETNYCECGKKISRLSKKCEKCDHIKQRKVKDRPPYHILIDEIKQFGYTGTGRKYNVSDNCIRKWLKNYETNFKK